jgi:hypothetical protein
MTPGDTRSQGLDPGGGSERIGDKALSLAEILTTVMDDLYAAEEVRRESGRAGRMAVNQLELELKVSTVEESSGSLKFYILGAGVTGRSETASTLKITLSASEGLKRVMLDEVVRTEEESRRQREYLRSIDEDVTRAEVDGLIEGLRSGMDSDQVLDGLNRVRARFE